MRVTGNRELEKLYRELEGIGFIPSFSYESLVTRLKEQNKYIANLRIDIEILDQCTVSLTIYDGYPKIFVIIEFAYGG